MQEFATDIMNNIDLQLILPHLIACGILSYEQQEFLLQITFTNSQKMNKLLNILLTLDEKGVKSFLKCLDETSQFKPHKTLLEKIQGN